MLLKRRHSRYCFCSRVSLLDNDTYMSPFSKCTPKLEYHTQTFSSKCCMQVTAYVERWNQVLFQSSVCCSPEICQWLDVLCQQSVQKAPFVYLHFNWWTPMVLKSTTSVKMIWEVVCQVKWHSSRDGSCLILKICSLDVYIWKSSRGL